MATFLFDKIIFGPVKSRRLGISLGINLLPVDRKFCNFDCIYCECGLNPSDNIKINLPSRTQTYRALKEKLSNMQQNGTLPDVITFAGNGEPTMHPDFPKIIDDAIELRDTYCPSASISVLSNATMLHKSNIVEALKKVDQNILKLDSGLENTVHKLNKPTKKINIESLINQLKQFNGKLIIQTMFIRGEINGEIIDNTGNEEIETWVSFIAKIKPELVMIYTIDRSTPFEGLIKIPLNELNSIANKLSVIGVKTQVSS